MKTTLRLSVCFILAGIGVCLWLSEPAPGEMEWDPAINLAGMGMTFFFGYMFKTTLDQTDDENT